VQATSVSQKTARSCYCGRNSAPSIGCGRRGRAITALLRPIVAAVGLSLQRQSGSSTTASSGAVIRRRQADDQPRTSNRKARDSITNAERGRRPPSSLGQRRDDLKRLTVSMAARQTAEKQKHDRHWQQRDETDDALAATG
jgi:hypothetical protein